MTKHDHRDKLFKEHHVLYLLWEIMERSLVFSKLYRDKRFSGLFIPEFKNSVERHNQEKIRVCGTSLQNKSAL